MQGTVADEQRLPQQLTFARLALLLVVAIFGSLELSGTLELLRLAPQLGVKAAAISYGIYVALISLPGPRSCA